jgi:hypothetical protein
MDSTWYSVKTKGNVTTVRRHGPTSRYRARPTWTLTFLADGSIRGPRKSRKKRKRR